jgi:aspartate/methionine/tyrosine aminotransferase
MGIDVRSYHLRHENDFEIDVDEVKRLVDERTKVLLINTPHNPTGMTVRPEILRELHDFATDRGIQFVVDEVYHPIYFGDPYDSAVTLPHATILGDTSKSLCSSGLRVGWIIERDRARRESHCNARSYFTISNTVLGEALTEVAVRHRENIFTRAQKVAVTNLQLLDRFFADQPESLEWIRPRGSLTAFPRMASKNDSRPFCQQAAEAGVLLAPGDCFGFPAHFRIGFGACHNGFDKALEILSDVLAERRNQSRTGVSRS